MEVHVERSEGLERRLRVQVPEERVKGEVDRRLGEMARTARIPGFRPGRVPMRVLAQRFGRQVRGEVVGEIVQSSLLDALAQEKLRPAGSPVIDPLEAEPGNGVSYTAVFDVFPEITLPDLATLTVRRPVAEVTEADVDAMIETLRRQRTTWREVERAAALGDRVVADLAGSVDGEPREGLGGEGVEIELGAGRMVAGLEDGLVGVQAGEQRVVELTFPEDHGEPELAGRPVRFEVTVHRVEEPVVPEVDDALAASFGVEEGGVEAFRREVRGNMERELADALRARIRDEVMNALLAAQPVDLPRALVDEEIERQMDERRRQLAGLGIDAERLELDRAHFEEAARRRVALGLVLAEVVRSNGLQADPERVRQRVESIASTYEQPAEVVRWIYSDRSRLEPIESVVLEDQVVEWVLERARVEEQPSSFDELLNPGQTSSKS